MYFLSHYGLTSLQPTSANLQKQNTLTADIEKKN